MRDDSDIIGESRLCRGVGVVSRQALEAVVGRAVIDEEFRLLLFADPDTALAGYELTEEEVAALKRVDAENLDGCAGVIGPLVLRSLAPKYRESGAVTAPDRMPP